MDAMVKVKASSAFVAEGRIVMPGEEASVSREEAAALVARGKAVAESAGEAGEAPEAPEAPEARATGGKQPEDSGNEPLKKGKGKSARNP